jgi:hypothetical protein
VCGDQLQPGVEDGGTPTEVVAVVELKEEEKTENTKKKRTLMNMNMNNTSEGRAKIEKKTRKSQKKGENRKQKIPKKEGPEFPGEGAAITSAAGSFQFNGFTK